MITKVVARFDVEAMANYQALQSHPFMRSRCSHHRTEVMGDPCIGEWHTIIPTHSWLHEVRLYESWDGCEFQLWRPEGISVRMFRAMLDAMHESGVRHVSVTLQHWEYKGIDIQALRRVKHYSLSKLKRLLNSFAH